MPHMIAVGDARPSAHGHEITSTEMPKLTAVSRLPDAIHQITNVTSAIEHTTGTKMPLILSASFCTGAFDVAASSTIAAIFATVVSSPTDSARISAYPVTRIVPQMSLSPTAFSTGTLSPVITLSSDAPPPVTITPSQGMPPPARMSTMSPETRVSAGIVTTSSPRRTSAVFGARSSSFRTASDVRRLARSSSVRPTVMSAKIIVTDSKCSSCVRCMMCAPPTAPITIFTRI